MSNLTLNQISSILGMIVLTAILVTVFFPTQQEPKLLTEGIEYVKSVDKFCYSVINENTEELHNITYKRGWGYAYRDCMLSNLNIKEHEIICDDWICRQKDTDYVMTAEDIEICGRYVPVSKYHWEAVCND